MTPRARSEPPPPLRGHAQAVGRGRALPDPRRAGRRPRLRQVDGEPVAAAAGARAGPFDPEKRRSTRVTTDPAVLAVYGLAPAPDGPVADLARFRSRRARLGGPAPPSAGRARRAALALPQRPPRRLPLAGPSRPASARSFAPDEDILEVDGELAGPGRPSGHAETAWSSWASTTATWPSSIRSSRRTTATWWPRSCPVSTATRPGDPEGLRAAATSGLAGGREPGLRPDPHRAGVGARARHHDHPPLLRTPAQPSDLLPGVNERRQMLPERSGTPRSRPLTVSRTPAGYPRTSSRLRRALKVRRWRGPGVPSKATRPSAVTRVQEAPA